MTNQQTFYNIIELQHEKKCINRNIMQIGKSDYVKLQDGKKGIIKFFGKTFNQIMVG